MLIDYLCRPDGRPIGGRERREPGGVGERNRTCASIVLQTARWAWSREPLQNFSADLLEFESLRQLLGRFVHSQLGHARARTAGAAFGSCGARKRARRCGGSDRLSASPLEPQAGRARRGHSSSLRFDSRHFRATLPMLRIEGAVLGSRSRFWI